MLEHGIYVHKDVGDARITIDSATNSDAMLRFLMVVLVILFTPMVQIQMIH